MFNIDFDRTEIAAQAIGMCAVASIKLNQHLTLQGVSMTDLTNLNAERRTISTECVELALFWMKKLGFAMDTTKGVPHLIVWDGITCYIPQDHCIMLGRDVLHDNSVLVHELVHSFQVFGENYEGNLPRDLKGIIKYAADRREYEAYSVQHAMMLAAAGGDVFGLNANHVAAVKVVAKATTVLVAPLQAIKVWSTYRNK